MLFIGAAFLLFFLGTLPVRERLVMTNAGYGLFGLGLLAVGFAQRYNAGKPILTIAAFVAVAGAVLLVYGWLVRKEIRAFRESLLPK